MSTFQDNLRQYRERLGINAKDFAAEIGIKYSTYASYENLGREPKYDTLCRIADALNVSIDDLLGYKPDRLEYWLKHFPSIPLFANLDEEKGRVIISTMNDEGKETYLVSLGKAEFIKEMERIEQKTKEEVSANYEKMFSLLTSNNFLERAFWSDHLLDLDEAERQIKEQEAMLEIATQKSPTD